jgi:hypothetical protein
MAVTTLTAGELAQALLAVPPETIVILQHDSEGNSYSPAAGVDTEALYLAETRYYGSVLAPDEADDSGGATDDCVPCVCLWPVN